MDSKSYDVALLPESKLFKQAIHLSKEVENFGTLFILGEDEYIPHISLYMLQLNADGLKQANKILEQIAKEVSVIEGQTTDYHYERGYFDIEYQKTMEFINVQNRIVEQLNPIRDGLRDKDKERLRTVSGEEKANIEQFGYRSIGNLFAPHLTFTRFIDTKVRSLDNLPSADSFDGSCVALGIFELGDHGTCRLKINEWSLKQ